MKIPIQDKITALTHLTNKLNEKKQKENYTLSCVREGRKEMFTLVAFFKDRPEQKEITRPLKFSEMKTALKEIINIGSLNINFMKV